MDGINWTKLITIICVAAGAVALGLTHSMGSEAVAAILSACLGYVFGNGHAVVETKSYLAANLKKTGGNIS